jgi:hypothetical protein
MREVFQAPDAIGIRGSFFCPPESSPSLWMLAFSRAASGWGPASVIPQESKFGNVYFRLRSVRRRSRPRQASA